VQEKQYKSESIEETIEFGSSIGEQLKPGDVVTLQGPLGSGKTHLVKGIAEALGIDKEQVHSPTYSLIHEYSSDIPLYHFDCYRMEDPHEALEIGAEEYFYGDGICVIEWPEKIAPILPDDLIGITLKSTGKTQRIFEVKKENR
jgi:tRNA threonylcarbamoyladenosine biosynthesis protein TsaE